MATLESLELRLVKLPSQGNVPLDTTSMDAAALKALFAYRVTRRTSHDDAELRVGAIEKITNHIEVTT